MANGFLLALEFRVVKQVNLHNSQARQYLSETVNPLRALCRATLPRSLRHQLLLRSYWLTRTGRREILAMMLKSCGRYIQPVSLAHATIYVDLRDNGVGRPIFVERDYEPTEQAFITSAVKPGMVAYDIGTNIGCMATLLGKAVGTSGRVIGFEPDPHNYSLAQRNVEKNSLSQVEVYNCALGAEKSRMKIYRSVDNYGDHRMYATESRAPGHEVAVERLEELVARDDLPLPDFIKIDVQGFEFKVFQGMPEILRQDRDLTILTEYWPYGIRGAGDDPIAYRQLFEANGFHAYELAPNGSLIDADWTRMDHDFSPDNPVPHSAYANIVFKKSRLR